MCLFGMWSSWHIDILEGTDEAACDYFLSSYSELESLFREHPDNKILRYFSKFMH